MSVMTTIVELLRDCMQNGSTISPFVCSSQGRVRTRPGQTVFPSLLDVFKHTDVCLQNLLGREGEMPPIG
jgi:hypothetical protein